MRDAPTFLEQLTKFCMFVFTEVSISTMLLFFLMVGGLVLAHKTQARADFDWADMLRDPVTKKPSSSRFFSFICLAISSWALVFIVLSPKHADQVFNVFAIYIAIWSGAKVVETGIEAWAGKRGVPGYQPPPVFPQQGTMSSPGGKHYATGSVFDADFPGQQYQHRPRDRQDGCDEDGLPPPRIPPTMAPPLQPPIEPAPRPVTPNKVRMRIDRNSPD